MITDRRCLMDLVRERMPQKDLAAALDITEGTVSGWMKRGVPPDRWEGVMDAAGITQEELLPNLSMQEFQAGMRDGWFTRRRMDQTLLAALRRALG